MLERSNRRNLWRLIPLLLLLVTAMGAGGMAFAGVPTQGANSVTQQSKGQDTPGKGQNKQVAITNDTVALSNGTLTDKGGTVGKSSDTTNSPDVFVNKAAVPVPVDRHASAASPTHLYLLGGEYWTGSAYAITSTVQRYDPVADTWAFMAPMPGPLDNAEACSMNGKIYVPGGYAGSGPPFSTNLYMYDITNNGWSTGPAVIGTPTLWPVVVCNAATNKVYVFGGFDGVGATAAVKIYDAQITTWTTGTSSPVARYGADGGLIGTKLFVAGGAGAAGTALTSVESYDIAGDFWTGGYAPMAVGGLYGSAGVFGTALYISGGGFGSDGSAYLARTERYDSVANTWSTVDPLLVAARHMNGGVVTNLFHADSGFNSPTCATPGNLCPNNQQLTLAGGATSTPTRTNTVVVTPTSTACVPSAVNFASVDHPVVVDGGVKSTSQNANGPAKQQTGTIQKNSGSVGSSKFVPLAEPKAPFVTLYDQYDNFSTTASVSQDFEAANNAFDAQLGDDFVVPAGQTWSITNVALRGLYFNGPGPAASMNVYFYTNGGTLPATPVYTATNLAFSVTGEDFSVPLTVPAVLSAGTYWVSVQARLDFTPGGEFGWYDRTVQSNSPAAFRNPGGGFNCPAGGAWAAKTGCIPTAGGPDQVFKLVGTIVGGGCPTGNGNRCKQKLQ